MSYKINLSCISCGACVSECPTNAIFEGEPIYHIDHHKCTECVGFFDSAQCAEVCPSFACVPDPERQESEAELIEKAKNLHPERAFPDQYPSHHQMH